MQIHEITRRPLNEFVGMRRTNVAKPTAPVAAPAATSGSATAGTTATASPSAAAKTSGSVGSAIANSLPGKVVTGTAAVAGGIGSALGKSLMSKAFGGVDVLGKGGTSQSREDLFKSMVNSPMAKQLATTMQASWAQTVQNFLANSKDANGNPPASLKTVSQPSVAALKQELHMLVNQMLGREYTQLASSIKDPVAKQGIQDVVADITQMIDGIYQAEIQGVDPKNMGLDWVKLVGDGILPAQNIIAYDQKRGSAAGSGGVGAVQFQVNPRTRGKEINFGQGYMQYDANNPTHKQAADENGIPW
jgi:hypothetical protein